MNSTLHRLLLPLLLLPLTTLADGRLPFTCDDHTRFELSLSTGNDGRPQATLHLADGELTLPQVPAAAGARYRTDSIDLHTRGDEALFDDGKGKVRRCQQGASAPASPASATPVVSSFLDIAGSVSYRQRSALPPDAVLIIRVQDAARAGSRPRTLAEQRIELGGQQVPVTFATTIDRDLIGKSARVTVSARIERRGKLLFVSDKPYPALANGQPIPVDIQLKQVARAKAV